MHFTFIRYSYYFIWILFFTLSWIIVKQKNRNIIDSYYIFWLVSFFIIFKIPSLFENYSLEIDEGCMLTQAMSLYNKRIFWKEVDFLTSGPLNSLILIPFGAIRGNFDYTACRICYIILNCVSIIFTYFTVNYTTNKSNARIFVFIVVIFLVSTNNLEFRHYSSELLSISLLSISLFFLVKIFHNTTSKITYYSFLNGTILGLLPFTKLQSLPLGVLIFLYSIWLLLKSQNSNKIKAIGWFFGGCSICPIIFIIYIINYNIVDTFKFLYLDANLIYGDNTNNTYLFSFIVKFLSWIKIDSVKIHLCISIFCLSLFLHTLKIEKLKVEDKKFKHFIYFTLLYLIVCAYIITKPGYYFEHYFYFYLFFSCILNSFMVLASVNLNKYLKSINSIILLIAISSVIYNLPRIDLREKEISSTSKFINKIKKGNESIALWGWNFDYYIETQSSQAALENHTSHLFKAWSHKEMIIDKISKLYLRNLISNKPIAIIDSYDSDFTPDAKNICNLKLYPSLYNYIISNYTVAKRVEKNVIYLRNDRFNELTQKAIAF